MKIFNRLYGRIQYKVRVNYKSGISQEFWCYNFKSYKVEFNWESVTDTNRPILLGVDDIESIYQVGYIKPLFVKK